MAKGFDEVINEIKNLSDKVENLSCQDDAILRVEEKLNKVYVAVFGNGDLSGGIVGRILIIDGWKKDRTWFERALIGCILSEAIALGFLAINTGLGEKLWILKEHLMTLLRSIF